MDHRAEAILELISRFAAAGDDETRHVDALRDLLRSSPAPLSRASFDPGHVTASAFIVDRDGARLLLHHHRRLDRWLQMGGHIDAGESVVDAALREAREESGLEALELVPALPFDIDVHAIPAGKGEPAHHHFDVRFIVRASDPGAIRIAHDESNDLRWFSLDDAIAAMNSPESTRAIGKIRSTATGKRS